MDFESVLVPEGWIEIAKATGIKKLQLTTRDVADFNQLMRMRIEIFRENNIKLIDAQNLLNQLEPSPRAKEFLNWLRNNFRVVVLSDYYYEFAQPLLQKLDNPDFLALNFQVDSEGYISDYIPRKGGSKQEVVKGFKNEGFYVISIGDSYNDVDMLQEADVGLFLHASDKVKNDFPNILAFKNYKELKNYILKNYVVASL